MDDILDPDDVISLVKEFWDAIHATSMYYEYVHVYATNI